jgi:hypothetical protein
VASGLKENSMKRAILLALPLMFAGAAVIADESVPRASPTDAQAIKTCMDKQKANSNVTMSEGQLKRYCKDKLKEQKATGAMPEKPPEDTPRDDTPHG